GHCRAGAYPVKGLELHSQPGALRMIARELAARLQNCSPNCVAWVAVLIGERLPFRQFLLPKRGGALSRAGCRGLRGGRWSPGLGPLGALPTAPRLVRGFTAVVLGGWKLAELAEDAELIVSELCSNVVRAATGPDGQ